MAYTIDTNKLKRVVFKFQVHPEGDPGATRHDVESHICYDGHEGDHQEWINDSDVSEIVDWLVDTWFE